MSKVKDHIHRLRRTTYASSGTKVYFCVNDCSFKIEVPFALGKIVECNICFQPFTMNEYTIKLAKPHCNACGKMQVKEADGKRRFINKGRPVQAITDLAKDAVTSMKERMAGKVVTVEKEEDI